jgi:hypothetical protein
LNIFFVNVEKPAEELHSRELNVIKIPAILSRLAEPHRPHLARTLALPQHHLALPIEVVAALAPVDLESFHCLAAFDEDQ